MNQRRCCAIILVVLLFCFKAWCSMGRPLADPTAQQAETYLVVSNTLLRLQAQSSQALIDELNREARVLPALGLLMPSTAPDYWLSEWMCDPVLRAVHSARGVATFDADISKVFQVQMTVSQADDCLRRATAFKELCTRTNAAVWEFMLERSRHESTILDLCVMGSIVWGSRFHLLPVAEFGPIELNETSLEASKWRLPVASSNQWRALLEGGNEVYRLMAAKAVGVLYSDSNDQLVPRLIGDSCLAIRHEAGRLIEQLPVERQIEICRKEIQRYERKVYVRDFDRNADARMKAELERRLRTVRRLDGVVQP